MAKPAAGENSYRQVTTSAGDVAIVVFSGVAEAAQDESTEIADSENVPATPSLAPRAGAAEFAAMVSGLQAGAKVEQNDFLLNGGGGSNY